MKAISSESALQIQGASGENAERPGSNGHAADSAALYNETTRPYLDLDSSEDQLMSFRYIRPWFGSLPVLDLGCAKGTYLRQFVPGSIGLDVSRPNLEYCRGLGLQVMAADLNSKLPFASESFPAILCSHVLEHVDAPIDLLRECNRVLSPSGTLVLGLPIENSIVNRLRGHKYFYHHPGHLYSFSLENIGVLLQKTDYDIVRFYFEPRIVRFRGWLSAMQRLPSGAMYALALAYWVVARKTHSGVGQG